MPESNRRLAVVGGLGVYPAIRLSLPSRRLFAFLAVHGGAVARAVAADQLWTDVAESQARANLRRALWQSPAEWIDSAGDTLELSAEVDLAALHAAASAAIDGGELTLDEITGLSHDLLPGWHEEWVVPAQEAFHLLRVQALEAACLTMAEHGVHALATQAGTAALAADPLRESAAFALIHAHLLEGNRHAAAARFHAFARILEAELGVEPDPALADAVHAAVAAPAAGAA
ncbi:BTAD domain-containing putative transcriptional regulator [Leifsonia sp. NPDC058248]|uniref:AfsR/SARP family transcriptional regulator n=1 Tax=Leifsonia sp. NPDC058248 TaxID=3346402 RepID=UPI0036D8EE3E